MQGNVITANAGLGIHLVADGNAMQPAPDLRYAATNGTSTTVQGTLTGDPGATLTVEFFHNSACNPAGFGDGEQFLGSRAFTLDDSGQASLDAGFGVGVDPSEFITATATDPANNTSQFSVCVPVSGALSLRGGRAAGLGLAERALAVAAPVEAVHVALSAASAEGRPTAFALPGEALTQLPQPDGMGIPARSGDPREPAGISQEDLQAHRLAESYRCLDGTTDHLFWFSLLDVTDDHQNVELYGLIPSVQDLNQPHRPAYDAYQHLTNGTDMTACPAS